MEVSPAEALAFPTLYTEFTLFHHATPEERLGPLARDMWKLFRHMHALMVQTV